MRTAEISAPAKQPATMAPALYRVENRRRETSDTCTLTLVPAGGSAPSRFLPGQFNMLYVFGRGEVPISISGDPNQPEMVVHTIRSVGVVTGALIDLKPGQTVGLRGPFGTPWPVKAGYDRNLLIVAGGIGLAPLRPVVYHALANREAYRRITLLYGSRTPNDLLFWKELEKWRARFDFEVHVTVDSARPEWRGNVGVVTRLLRPANLEPENTTAMVCGPEVMMRLTVRDLVQRGIDPDNVYVSMERNMKCAMGFCGHCQLGAEFICKDGPVFRYSRIENLIGVREL